jgi:hypothetical protein
MVMALLGVKPRKMPKLLIHKAPERLIPNKEMPGFVRKGRALVFAATGGRRLTKEIVQKILEETRDERHRLITANATRRHLRRKNLRSPKT